MADTGLVIPDLETVISRKLAGRQPKSYLDDPEYMRTQELHELLLYNQELNKDKPIPEVTPPRGMFSNLLGVASNVAGPLETGVMGITGTAATVGGGLASLGNYINRLASETSGLMTASPKFDPTMTQKDIAPLTYAQENLTYEPRTTVGQIGKEVVMAPVHVVQAAANAAQNLATNLGAPPLISASIGSAVEIAALFATDAVFRRAHQSKRANATNLMKALEAKDLIQADILSKELLSSIPEPEIAAAKARFPNPSVGGAPRQPELPPLPEIDAANPIPGRQLRVPTPSPELSLSDVDVGLERLAAENTGLTLPPAETAGRFPNYLLDYFDVLLDPNASPNQHTVAARRINRAANINDPAELISGLKRLGLPADIIDEFGGYLNRVLMEDLRRPTTGNLPPEEPPQTLPVEGVTQPSRNPITGQPIEIPKTNPIRGMEGEAVGPSGGTISLQGKVPPIRVNETTQVLGNRQPARTNLEIALDTFLDDSTSITAKNTALRNIKTEALKAAPGKLEEGLRQLGIEEELISDLLPRLKNVRAARTNVPRAKTVGEPTSTVQNLVPETQAFPAGDPRNFQAAFSGLAEGATKGLRDALWSEYQRSSTTLGGNQELVLMVADNLKKNGVELSRVRFDTTLEEVTRIRKEVADAGGGGPELTTRMQQYINELKTELQPSPISVDIPPTEPAPVKTPTRVPTRKTIPIQEELPPSRSSYQAYEARVTQLDNVPQPDLVMGEMLRRENVVLTEAEFNKMSSEVNALRPSREIFKNYMDNYIQQRGAEAEITKPAAKIPANQIDYVPVTSLNDLSLRNNEAGSRSKTVPIQVRREGGTPVSIIINDRALQTRSLADVTAEASRMERSNIPPAGRQRNALEMAKINAKAELFGITAEEAAQINGAELRNRLFTFASENNLGLYKVERGNTNQIARIEEVPKNVVETSAKLNDGNPSSPKKISVEDRAQYIAETQRENAPYSIEEILENLSEGVDITSNLPPKLAEIYGRGLVEHNKNLTQPDALAWKEVVQAIMDIFPSYEEGTLGANFPGSIGPKQKLALQTLKNEAIRQGKDIYDLIRGSTNMGDIQKQLYTEYLRSIEGKTPEPKSIRNLANMPFDSAASARGDFVVKRAEGDAPNTFRPEIYNSEYLEFKNAKEMTPAAARTMLQRTLRPEFFRTNGVRRFQDAGIESVMPAYRAVERALAKEEHATFREINKVGRQFTGEQRDAIGAYGIAQQPDGLANLKKSGVAVRELTQAESLGYNYIRGNFEELFTRLNEVRARIGKEPLNYVKDYMTFMRTMLDLERQGTLTNLVTESSKDISARFANSRATPFPSEKTRTGKTYPLEVDAFNILRSYTQRALEYIHLSPFKAKIHELINTPIKDPVTGKNYRFVQDKPVLNKFINEWLNAISRQPIEGDPIKGGMRNAMFMMDRGLTGSYIAFNEVTGLTQLSSILNTYIEAGAPQTIKAVTGYLADLAVPSHPKRAFRLKNSQMLDTRGLDIAVNEFAEGIVNGVTRRNRALQTASELVENTTKVGMYPTRILDGVSAEIAWDVGYNIGKKRGLTETQAFNLGDDLLTRTQGSTLRGERSNIQRYFLGRLATRFQNFAINNWDQITHDIFGIDNPKLSNKDKAVNITRLMFGGMAMNALSEYLFGYSPVFNPIGAVYRQINESQPTMGIVPRALNTILPERFQYKEPKPIQYTRTDENWEDFFTRLVGGPIVGEALKVAPMIGSARISTASGAGPLADYSLEVARAASGAPQGRRLSDLAIRGIVPGGAQINEMMRPERNNTNSLRSVGESRSGLGSRR